MLLANEHEPNEKKCPVHVPSMIYPWWCVFVGACLAWTVVLVCPLGGPLGGLHGLFWILL